MYPLSLLLQVSHKIVERPLQAVFFGDRILSSPILILAVNAFNEVKKSFVLRRGINLLF